MKFRFLSSLLLISVLSSNALADGYSRFSHKGGPIQVVVGLGFTFGGDDLLKFDLSDSDVEELSAGEFFDFKLGVSYRIPNKPFAVQATAGYFFDTITTDIGDATLSRVPIDVSFLYNYDDHVFGLGLTHHTAINADITLPADGETVAIGDIDYEDSTGFFLEYGYQIAANITLSLRSVFMDYEEQRGAETLEFDANHYGIYGIINF